MVKSVIFIIYNQQDVNRENCDFVYFTTQLQVDYKVHINPLSPKDLNLSGGKVIQESGEKQVARYGRHGCA